LRSSAEAFVKKLPGAAFGGAKLAACRVNAFDQKIVGSPPCAR
jgi:hypothetical protein